MFHTPAHKQSAHLAILRNTTQNPALRALAKPVLAHWEKIEQVVAATGASSLVATGYLQAEEWLVTGAIETLLADRRAGLHPAKLDFKVETLRPVH